MSWNCTVPALLVVLLPALTYAQPWRADVHGDLAVSSTPGSPVDLDASLQGELYWRRIVDDGFTPYGAETFFQHPTQAHLALDGGGVWPFRAKHGNFSAGLDLFNTRENVAVLVQVNALRGGALFAPVGTASLDLGAQGFFNDHFRGQIFLRSGFGNPEPGGSPGAGPPLSESYLAGGINSARGFGSETFYEESLHLALTAFLAHRHLRLEGRASLAVLFTGASSDAAELDASLALSGTYYFGRRFGLSLELSGRRLDGNDTDSVRPLDGADAFPGGGALFVRARLTPQYFVAPNGYLDAFAEQWSARYFPLTSVSEVFPYRPYRGTVVGLGAGGRF